ncbi:AAA family ATPase [Granulicatella sp. UMB5615A]|uniref:McrB family protein n=3 Tax=unclassified Granulicatella TaxID=2630493 RepID=UPI002554375F|nr:AAA family ATPase [Granulicatella sp. UMB5615A]MDK8522295.1 AAA family ATPase [Granulicatella sp. UMB5615A]
MKKAYLLTWNPENWNWPDYKEKVKVIKEGKTFIESWTSSSKQPKVGDQVFLLKNKVGIIGHGHVEKASYDAPHYNSEKAQEGLTTNHIDVKFDWLMDEIENNYIPIDLLESVFSKQTWRPQSSGIEIKEEYINDLENVYRQVKLIPNSRIDFDALNNFLENYCRRRYSDPEKAENQKAEMEEIKKVGQAAYSAFNRYGKFIEKLLPGFKMKKSNSWQNSGNLMKYFWIEYKKEGYEDLAHSISISMNAYPEYNKRKGVTLSVRVEAKDSQCKKDSVFSEKEVYKIHNSILDFPIKKTDNLYYQASVKPKERKLFKKFGNDAGEVHKELDQLEKVQIVKEIIGMYEEQNTPDILMQTVQAIAELMPYYEHILEVRENRIKEKEGSLMINEEPETTYIENQSGNTFVKNSILYGPPGTGKTYYTAYYSVAICDDLSIEELEKKSYGEVLERFNTLKKEGRIAFTTFHQSYGYEEFIEGIRPVMAGEEEKKSIEYEIVPGVFKKFCDEAALVDDEPYIFIIDEINRGNISKIFGELITLIEGTKRKGEREELSAFLPYSQEEFGVPKNVYILGTMNTADRSIALMDTALRRRFNFIEMMPDCRTIEDVVIRQNGKEVNIGNVLDIMNRRIEFLFDREHTIGHAFFTSLKNDNSNSIGRLAAIFRNSIIPLLQEYFYDDYEKIRLVLGDNHKKDEQFQFIKKANISPKALFGESIRLESTALYSLNEDALWKIESYQGILLPQQEN